MFIIKYTLYFIIIAISSMAATTHAAEKNLDFLVSDNPQSQYVAKKLQSKFFRSEHGISINTFDTNNSSYKNNSSTDTLTISIGSKSTELLINNNPNNAIYSLMVPKIIYSNLLKRNNLTIKHSALYLDQPFRRYLLLIKKLSPKLKRIGIFTNNNLSDQKDSYELIANELGFELITQSINTDANPINEINELFSKTDIALLLPEKIINQLSAKWILYSAYRNKKPVIGFSKKFLDAGALASLHSNLDEIVEEAYREIVFYLQNDRFKNNPHYPQEYEIKFNETVSRSLNITTKANEIDDL